MPSSLLSLPLLFLLLSTTIAAAAGFTCTTSSNCTALIQYISVNDTTLSSIQSLFSLPHLRSLLSANSLPLSTPKSYHVAASTPINVPFPCLCGNGSGFSDHRPVYVVQPGNFLYEIASVVFASLTTVADIVQVNGIQNASSIGIGQKLWIPLPCSCDDVSGEKVVHYGYVVPTGASLAGIAAEYGTTETVLEGLNGNIAPAKLQAGQLLDVPLKACSSSVNSTSLDANLLVANGTYVLTANGCVKCTCSPANNYTLQCESSQLKPVSNWSTCPSTLCGGLNLGNTTTSGCNISTCSYAGYTSSTILTTTVITTSSSCTTSKSHASRLNLGGWSSTAVLCIVHLPMLLYSLQFW
ncbi:hypothetical protein Droror1_Dr00006892 [Drosera rotundifolia]